LIVRLESERRGARVRGEVTGLFKRGHVTALLIYSLKKEEGEGNSMESDEERGRGPSKTGSTCSLKNKKVGQIDSQLSCTGDRVGAAGIKSAENKRPGKGVQISGSEGFGGEETGKGRERRVWKTEEP